MRFSLYAVCVCSTLFLFGFRFITSAELLMFHRVLWLFVAVITHFAFEFMIVINNRLA